MYHNTLIIIMMSGSHCVLFTAFIIHRSAKAQTKNSLSGYCVVIYEDRTDVRGIMTVGTFYFIIYLLINSPNIL